MFVQFIIILALSKMVPRHVYENSEFNPLSFIQFLFLKSFSFLPTSLAGSVLHLIVETYFAIRFVSRGLSHPFTFKALLTAIKSLDVWRAVSLICLDGVTLYPDAFPTPMVSQYVPLSVAGLLVLGEFIHRFYHISPTC